MIESVFNFFRFMGDKRSLALLFVLLALAPASTRARTVGLFLNEPEAYDGYTLFAPMRAAATYLIDNQGWLVHSWESSLGNATAVYLLEDGRLLRTARYDGRTSFDAGGAGGVIELVQWDGLVDWRFEYSSDQYLAHHDVEYLPNGNVLLIAWEKIDRATALSAGRNPTCSPAESCGRTRSLKSIQPAKSFGSGGSGITWSSIMIPPVPTTEPRPTGRNESI